MHSLVPRAPQRTSRTECTGQVCVAPTDRHMEADPANLLPQISVKATLQPPSKVGVLLRGSERALRKCGAICVPPLPTSQLSFGRGRPRRAQATVFLLNDEDDTYARLIRLITGHAVAKTAHTTPCVRPRLWPPRPRHSVGRRAACCLRRPRPARESGAVRRGRAHGRLRRPLAARRSRTPLVSIPPPFPGPVGTELPRCALLCTLPRPALDTRLRAARGSQVRGGGRLLRDPAFVRKRFAGRSAVLPPQLGRVAVGWPTRLSSRCPPALPPGAPRPAHAIHDAQCKAAPVLAQCKAAPVLACDPQSGTRAGGTTLRSRELVGVPPLTFARRLACAACGGAGAAGIAALRGLLHAAWEGLRSAPDSRVNPPLHVPRPRAAPLGRTRRTPPAPPGCDSAAAARVHCH
jgi:hypothetical protein